MLARHPPVNLPGCLAREEALLRLGLQHAAQVVILIEIDPGQQQDHQDNEELLRA